jgi:predicted enzyme involved in methoxymalonyl-ACP biosynthesis
MLRLDSEQVREYISHPKSAVYVLEARDRFSSYGLVGVTLLRQDEVVGFVLSCRVIPLNAEVPFLCTALRHTGREPIRATILHGPRNQPCRGLYKDAGFEEVAHGCYLMRRLAELAPINEGIYQIEMFEESI